MCTAAGDKPKAAVLNKSDLSSIEEPKTLEGRFDRVFIISALKKEGIEALVQWLSELAPKDQQPVITSARQARLMEEASEDLALAAESAAIGMTADAFLSDVERAIRHLGEVTENRRRLISLKKFSAAFASGNRIRETMLLFSIKK